jgi:hypothetical protein
LVTKPNNLSINQSLVITGTENGGRDTAPTNNRHLFLWKKKGGVCQGTTDRSLDRQLTLARLLEKKQG